MSFLRKQESRQKKNVIPVKLVPAKAGNGNLDISG